MAIDAGALAGRISAETGLDFIGSSSRAGDGGQTYQLQPAHHPTAHTFTLNILVGWRSIDMDFRPGSFSSDLLRAMGAADPSGRSGFVSVLRSSLEEGAQIALTLNGGDCAFDDPAIWTTPWQRLTLSMRKGMLPLNDGNADADAELVGSWVSRLSAAVLALLPLEANEALDQTNPTETVAGLPEGAKLTVEVNRYERDRRNRAAALAIHGHVCKACDMNMGHQYGVVASGLIEVHHTTPVSQLGQNYIIDPRTDLVPLCPNCHAVAHRRSPPYSVAELRNLRLASAPR